MTETSATPPQVGDRAGEPRPDPSMPPGPSTARTVEIRRVRFDEGLDELPRHFAAEGDLIDSHLMAAMSSMFPDGEEFFVRSVRHFRGEITDPVLAREVAGFIGQESLHGREHRAVNRRLAELGYPTRMGERTTRVLLGLRERLFPAKANLAATAALEHFTATWAEMALTQEREHHAHPVVADLMTWHALEETEHKAVAFDVYRAVGGTERTRVWTMRLVRVGFSLALFVQTFLSLLGDRDTYRPGVLRASLRRFRSNPLVGPWVRERLKDYDRPDFHPDDHDTSALLDEWRATLFGEDCTLTHRLATPYAA